MMGRHQILDFADEELTGSKGDTALASGTGETHSVLFASHLSLASSTNSGLVTSKMQLLRPLQVTADNSPTAGCELAQQGLLRVEGLADSKLSTP